MSVFETLSLMIQAGILLIALITLLVMLIKYIKNNEKNNAPAKASVIF